MDDRMKESAQNDALDEATKAAKRLEAAEARLAAQDRAVAAAQARLEAATKRRIASQERTEAARREHLAAKQRADAAERALIAAKARNERETIAPIAAENRREEETDAAASSCAAAENKSDSPFSTVLLCLLFAAIIACAVLIVKAHRDVVDTYDRAVEYVDNGLYAEAMELFESIDRPSYKDRYNYIRLCRAHISYSQGDGELAYEIVQRLTFEDMTEEQQDAFLDFYAETVTAHRAYLKKQEEEELEALKEKLKNELPYVGMPESLIAETSLGAPEDTIEHSYKMYMGKNRPTNIYDFKKDGKIIYIVSCFNGEVLYVFDHRDEPLDPSFRNKTYSSGTGKKSSEKEKNYVDDFYGGDFEEFYYDNMDEFADIDEAEEYYYDLYGR